MTSFFSSKQKTRTNQTQTNTATTTPNVPTALAGPYQDFLTNNVAGLSQQVNQNPQQFIPGANPLQQQAYGGAANLGGWQGLNSTASQLALAGATGGANLAGSPQTYQASQIPGVNLGPAPQGSATSFQAPQIGAMSGYQAPQVDINSILSGLGSAPSVSAGNVGPAAQATAADASGLIGGFMNPYTQSVVDTSLADFDQSAGATRAAQAAASARTGAFGGSRDAITRSMTEGELSRARGALDANIRSQGYNTAVGAALQQAGINTGASQFNAGQSNENARTQAGLDTQAGIAGAGFARDFGLAGLDARTRTALTQAGLDADSNRFLSEANNNRTMQQGQFDYGAAAQSNDAANRFGLANLDMQGQYGLRGAELGLQRDITQAGLNTDASRYAADAFNTNDRFNAGQRDSALARLLQGSQITGGLASDQGAQSRADVGAQLEAGNQQYGVDAAQSMAPLSLNALLSQMYGQFPLQNFTGQTVNSNGSLQGTNVQTSTPSPFNIGMSLASLFPSDPAFKTDVEPVGTANGHNLYRYRYLWDDPDRPLRTGVMADEIEDTRPDAVAIINGMRHVDYGALGLSHLVEA